MKNKAGADKLANQVLVNKRSFQRSMAEKTRINIQEETWYSEILI
ncbi:MAG: hypothetical protein ACLUE7_01400 [Lachnospirales bacterium]